MKKLHYITKLRNQDKEEHSIVVSMQVISDQVLFELLVKVDFRSRICILLKTEPHSKDITPDAIDGIFRYLDGFLMLNNLKMLMRSQQLHFTMLNLKKVIPEKDVEDIVRNRITRFVTEKGFIYVDSKYFSNVDLLAKKVTDIRYSIQSVRSAKELLKRTGTLNDVGEFTFKVLNVEDSLQPRGFLVTTDIDMMLSCIVNTNYSYPAILKLKEYKPESDKDKLILESLLNAKNSKKLKGVSNCSHRCVCVKLINNKLIIIVNMPGMKAENITDFPTENIIHIINNVRVISVKA